MNTDKKVSILKEMRKRIESGYCKGLCGALEKAMETPSHGINLSDLGIIKPDNADSPYWFPEFDKESRLKLIDEALAKCETDPIKEAEQRVKDAQAELERLKNTPKDVEGLYKENGEFGMWYINSRGKVYPYSSGAGYKHDAYLSKERAEKELLRIRLAFIADSLNGGLFECVDDKAVYQISYNQNTNNVDVSSWAYRHGAIYFKTRELAEQAMTYFTKDELIKMLS